jgi:hypothetical protein
MTAWYVYVINLTPPGSGSDSPTAEALEAHRLAATAARSAASPARATAAATSAAPTSPAARAKQVAVREIERERVQDEQASEREARQARSLALEPRHRPARAHGVRTSRDSPLLPCPLLYATIDRRARFSLSCQQRERHPKVIDLEDRTRRAPRPLLSSSKAFFPS